MPEAVETDPASLVPPGALAGLRPASPKRRETLARLTLYCREAPGAKPPSPISWRPWTGCWSDRGM